MEDIDNDGMKKEILEEGLEDTVENNLDNSRAEELELMNEAKLEIFTEILPTYDVSRVKEIFNDNPGKSVYVYSNSEVGTPTQPGFFSRFAPSVVFAINLGLPREEKRILYSKGRFGYGINKLAYLLSTIDKSIMFGHAGKSQMMSKIHNLNSVCGILDKPEFHMDELDESVDYSMDEVISNLIAVKKRASSLLRELEIVPSGSEEKRLVEHHFSYPAWFREKLGDNLENILLYGSSATGEGNDFDNILIVDELNPEIYDNLANTKPHESGKPVGGLFIESDIFQKYMVCNANNRIVAITGKLLLGNKLCMPIDDDYVITLKELHHAAMGTMQLRSAVNLVFKRGEDVFDKEGLFEFFMKIPRFTLGAFKALETYKKTGKYRFFEKEPLMEILSSEFSYSIPKLRNDLDYIKSSFLLANEINSRIISNYFDNELVKEEDEFLFPVYGKMGNIALSVMNGRSVRIFDPERNTEIGDIIPGKVISYSNPIVAERL
ncbi:MAG: hypothetical protein NTV63_03270 [Candidatus Woesearchaeota archaeon]|nr:hypothetical protein [Candidatus Woesearchaeota archaeon]